MDTNRYVHSNVVMKFHDPEVQAVFDAYAPGVRKRLLALRALIFEVATAQGVGPLTETLKWGQPSYLTEKTKSGGTIRMVATTETDAI